MKIRVLGCHGSDHFYHDDSGVKTCRTCCFLVDGSLLVDAGTIGSVLTEPEQHGIRHILVTHLHFDHIKGLPTFADNLADEGSEQVVLLGTEDVLQGLQRHVFNEAVYPDFTRLPSPDRPIFQCRPLELRKPTQVGEFLVTAIPVHHAVPTVGFLIEKGEEAILYSGDTYVTDEIWEVAAGVPHLKAAFIETSYPSSKGELAYMSRHLTPSLLAGEFKKIGRPDLPLYVYHLKPRFREEIAAELKALGLQNLNGSCGLI